MILWVIFIIIVTADLTPASRDVVPPMTRNQRLLNVFSTIRFKNGPCAGNNGLNGTCYTLPECSQRGGLASGSCASGFGTCCTFSMSCGGRSNANCTYFNAPATGSGFSGACKLTVCPCNNNICQLRLDFVNFVISGPSTVTSSVVKTIAGTVLGGGTVPSSLANQCLTDSFSVTNSDGCKPPTICGTNSGEHMYVNADSDCNDLVFQLGNTAMGITGIASRTWQIKVTQYSCDYENLAPDCCTQYFYGSDSQSVKTFNYDGGQHLASQDQQVCVRRERNICKICWTTEADTDFMLTGSAMGLLNNECCSYKNDGLGMKGYDCVIIPGAEKDTANEAIIKGSKFCGKSKGLGITGMMTAGNTVCSTSMPFSIKFQTDAYEAAAMETALQKGAKLTYLFKNC